VAEIREPTTHPIVHGPGAEEQMIGPRESVRHEDEKLTAADEAERLDTEAEVSAAQVRRNIRRSSNYVLGVVLFSIALFFAGTST
jgi:hypothetical protein